MSDYKYGVYGHQNNSETGSAASAELAAVVIGTAPVNLIRGYAEKNIINEPVKLSDISAKGVIGYSNDWNKFTLCETISAQFDNGKGNVGPVYAINVLNPDTHRTEAQEHNITFVNGEAVIESDAIIIDTFAIENKVEGVDYELSYNFNSGKLIVTSINKSSKLTGVVACIYSEVDMAAVNEDVFIGSKKDGVYSGAHVIEKLYPYYGVVPVYVAAPGWSEKPAIYEKLCDMCYQINNHWFGFVLADLPLVDEEGDALDSFNAVRKYKKENGYVKHNSKVYWPQVVAGSQVYHLSSLALVERMRVDMSKDGVPCGTDGNKTIPASRLYFGEDSDNQGYDQEDANELVQDGITTACAWAGQIKLWGDHTAAYCYDDESNIDRLYHFDANVLMSNYTLNMFQEMFGDEIDENMNMGLKDSITNTFQNFLDGLKASGALVGTPTVTFRNTGVDEMSKGHFVWDAIHTNAPLAKSLELYSTYTDAGILELMEGE